MDSEYQIKTVGSMDPSKYIMQHSFFMANQEVVNKYQIHGYQHGNLGIHASYV